MNLNSVQFRTDADLVIWHDVAVKKLLATVDEDFAEIDRLLRGLRKRLALAAEAVHVVAERTAQKAQPRRQKAKKSRRLSRRL